MLDNRVWATFTFFQRRYCLVSVLVRARSIFQSQNGLHIQRNHLQNRNWVFGETVVDLGFKVLLAKPCKFEIIITKIAT